MLQGGRSTDRGLLSYQQEIAARNGLLGDETETPDGTRVVGVVPSLCENELYPWDASLIRALRSLDPWIVPVGVKYVCKTTANTEFTVFRHALARMPRPVQQGYHADFMMNVTIPCSPSSVNRHARHPMIWLNVLHKQPPDNWDLPGIIGGPYQDLNWAMFYNSREETRTPQREAKDRHVQREGAKAYHERKARAMHDDSWDENWKDVKRQFNGLDITQRKNMHQPIEHEPKPFVDLGE